MSIQSPPSPKVKSFLIADQVFRQDNGKWCLIGIFSRIWATRFPTMHPSLGLYLKLTEAEGNYDIRVEFRDSDGHCLANLEGVRISVKDRLAEADLGLQGHNLLIPRPGTYFLKVFFNDQEATDAPDIRLEVRKHEVPQ